MTETVKTPRLKKLRLTQTESNLLQHPPKPDTWTCKGTYVTTNGEKLNCKMANKGSDTNCWLCSSARVKNIVLWPIYVEACSKVGVEPGDRWQQVDAWTCQLRKPGQKWEPATLPVGYKL